MFIRSRPFFSMRLRLPSKKGCSYRLRLPSPAHNTTQLSLTWQWMVHHRGAGPRVSPDLCPQPSRPAAWTDHSSCLLCNSKIYNSKNNVKSASNKIENNSYKNLRIKQQLRMLKCNNIILWEHKLKWLINIR